ncbi:adenosine receptor A2b-like [Nematostella vectensis]|uniref:adenosine receptor A2b-like n=1 Tax=Nematostella vectensis TaxID=45351 RepID=UPI0020774EA9|nr:adenosine receptor A2b-like [Nematostella vectensis]
MLLKNRGNMSHFNQTLVLADNVTYTAWPCHYGFGPGVVLSSTSLVVGLLGSIGNLLVCFTVLRSYELRNTPHYLLFNLAMADLMVSLSLPLFSAWMVGLIHGRCYGMLSHVRGFVLNTSVLASVSTLVIISIERMAAVMLPLRHLTILTARRLGIMVTISWLLSSIYGALIASDVQNQSYEHYFIFTVASLGGLCLQFALIIACYTAIFVKLLVQSRKRVHLQTIQSLRYRTFLLEARVAKTTAIVVGAFVFCWAPFICLRLVAHAALVTVMSPWTELLAQANSSLNPVIYFYRFAEYRRAYIRVFRRAQCCRHVAVKETTATHARSGTSRRL